MIIKFSDDTKLQGRIFTQTGSTMRVALDGASDLVDFTCISGQWVSEDCEPVEIEFAWQRTPKAKVVSELDCICSPELASRLMQSLMSDSLEDEVAVTASEGVAG
jgi:hypothetical protein